MGSTEQIAKSASMPKSGFFATLAASLHLKGTGALSTDLSERAQTLAANRSRVAHMKLALLSLPALLLASLVFTAASAQAGTIHIFGGSFGSKGTGSGQFEEPTGIAVNDVTHDVYVVDSANNRVEEFNATGSSVLGEFNGSAAPSGAFLSPGGPSGIAVDNSGQSALEDPSVGDVYVIDRGHKVVDKFSEVGAYQGQLTGTCENPGEVPAEGCPGSASKEVIPFGELEGVAVSADGQVWVSQANGTPSGEVDSYSDAAVSQFLARALLEDCCGSVNPGLAVDAEHNIYVDIQQDQAGEFTATGSVLSYYVNNRTGVTGMAVDLATNETYFGNTTNVEKYSAERAFIEAFGSGQLTGGAGVAVDAGNGTVYVADALADAVAIFDEVPVPDVSTGAPGLQTTSVTLRGTVNPQGPTLTNCEFELGSEAGTYTRTVECSPAAGAITGTEPVVVEANVSGLTRYTPYHYRLVAANENGTVQSPDAELVTAGAGITDESVSDVTASSALLGARIDPNGLDTHYYFQYSTEGTEGCAEDPSACIETPVVPGAELGAAKGIQSREEHVQKLQPGTTYHYRVVTVQGSETFVGPDRTFTTPALSSIFALPDGREWELVSPANKGGGQVWEGVPERGVIMQASESGEAITYITTAPVGSGAQSSPIVNQVLSERGPAGWTSQSLDTRHEEATIREFNATGLAFFYDEYLIFSPDLSLAYVRPDGHTPLAGVAPPGNGEPYIRDNATGTFTPTTMQSNEWYAEQLAKAEGPKSCDPSTSPAKGEGVDDVSRDGCYVYFNSEAILAPGAVGPYPLYLAHDEGGTWTTTFMSSFSATPPRWGGGAELSPNGRYLAFMSEASLTGYDNEDVTSQNAGERIDEEVFLYDAVTNHLVCASCNPSGARPQGVHDGGFGFTLVDEAEEWLGHWLAGTVPYWSKASTGGKYDFPSPIYQPRYVFNEGRVFFDSADALVPQDVNSQMDVYEYEPEGANCSKTAGCVSLISSGAGIEETALVDSSVSGDDVFFMTSSKLVSQDYDSNYDMYDAHVCSVSVPCTAPAPLIPPSCETGDSCKGAVTPQPANFGAPSSETFTGFGNPSPRPPAPETLAKKAVKCAKGKKPIHGRCITHKKRKAKKATKRATHRRGGKA